MKILILSENVPERADQGDMIRLSHFVRWLSPRHEISIAFFGSDRYEIGNFASVSPPSFSGKVIRAFLLPHLPVSVASRRIGHMKRLLAESVAKESYDLFFIYQTKMASYLPSLPGPAVVDLTDAVSLYYSRMAVYAGLPLRLFYRIEQYKMMRFERRLLGLGVKCVVSSEIDACYLRGFASEARIAVIPNGVDTGYFTPAPETGKSNNIVFVGNMVYPPNRDAVKFYYRQVFSRILDRCPDARLVVVGKNPQDDIIALGTHPSVEITGYVSDVRPYLANAAVVISPVRFGAGTRIKILEAMSMGRAVVSTALGCEGLKVNAGEDIMIADDPEEMAAIIVDLLENREKAAKFGEMARKTACKEYDFSIIGRQLEDLLVAELESSLNK